MHKANLSAKLFVISAKSDRNGLDVVQASIAVPMRPGHQGGSAPQHQASWPLTGQLPGRGRMYCPTAPLTGERLSGLELPRLGTPRALASRT